MQSGLWQLSGIETVNMTIGYSDGKWRVSELIYARECNMHLFLSRWFREITARLSIFFNQWEKVDSLNTKTRYTSGWEEWKFWWNMSMPQRTLVWKVQGKLGMVLNRVPIRRWIDAKCWSNPASAVPSCTIRRWVCTRGRWEFSLVVVLLDVFNWSNKGNILEYIYLNNMLFCVEFRWKASGLN